MIVLTLIECGEGELASVFQGVGESVNAARVALEEAIERTTEVSAAKWTAIGRESDAAYMREEGAARLAMIKAHEDWSIGTCDVKTVEPLWMQTTLIVNESEGFGWED